MATNKNFVVKANKLFSDARTGKTFHAGDEVTGWDEARAKHYEARGLVTVVELAPEKEDAQMKLEDAKKPGPEVAKETDEKPGPEVVKETDETPGQEAAKETEDEPESANTSSSRFRRSSRSRKK